MMIQLISFTHSTLDGYITEAFITRLMVQGNISCTPRCPVSNGSLYMLLYLLFYHHHYINRKLVQILSFFKLWLQFANNTFAANIQFFKDLFYT